MDFQSLNWNADLFSHLFFILLALILINFVPDIPIQPWISSPMAAFEAGLLLYSLLLFILYLQVKWIAQSTTLSSSAAFILVNLELLLFLSLYHFGLGAHRFFMQGPWLETLQAPFYLFSLTLYLLGLGWYHYWSAYFRLVKTPTSAFHYAWLQLQFIFPFCLPFILFSLLFDGLSLIPQWSAFLKQADHSILHTIILVVLGLLTLLPTLILMPPLIVACWGCKPLTNPKLISRLQLACHQAQFRHAGFKIWTVMKHSFTAGIIGVIPRFRYIMFTPYLIEEFSPDELEAILIHEMGHSRYKHLLIYPFILLGMFIFSTLLSFFYVDWLADYFTRQQAHHPSDLWPFLFAITVFILYAASLATYFRLVFGFFSRFFERQADLYIFNFSLSPLYLIESLDHIATLTGHTHHQPNWHHYSIQKRIDFLRAAMANPSLIIRHHRRVRFWVRLYFILLIISGLIFIFLI